MAVAMHSLTSGDNHLDASAGLFAAVSTAPHNFLQPSVALHAAAVLASKHFLDPLAADIVDAQTRRRLQNKRKRKRSEADDAHPILQLREVYTEGLGVNQVWEQARRVLNAARDEILRCLPAEKTEASQPGLVNGAGPSPAGDEETMSIDEEDAEPDSDDESANYMGGEDYEDDAVDKAEIDFDAEGTEDLDEDEVADIQGEDVKVGKKKNSRETFVQDRYGLNDEFFSIDDFNKQSQFLEQQDARGEDDNPSDEDDIDWDADPLSMAFHNPKSGHNQADEDDEESGDDEAGPTFGDADLNASDSDDAEIEDGGHENSMPGLDNTNDIRYADFFEPPPKRPSKTKRMRPLPKTQPAPAQQPAAPNDDEIETDIQRAISDVRRDLFDSEEEDVDDATDDDGDDASDSDGHRVNTKRKIAQNANLSTHEKQQLAIAAEIRRLEALSVSKRDWTLSGEARAADRPVNSLIEEDLEFERVGKPVPVITAEISEDIEALIKRRIIARDFDEVVRRRPEAVGAANEARRGKVEISDQKSKEGLAEIYEAEYEQGRNPGAYVDKRSAATKKQHDDITRLWREVEAQLDILSNLHFKPKRTEVDVKIVSDKPRIEMEDARPVGLAMGADESMLAPQEVYRVGEEPRSSRRADTDNGAAAGEVVRKGGATTSKEEMSREEKLRQRRRQKERSKKATGNRPLIGGPQPRQQQDNGGGEKAGKKGTGKGTAAERKDILSELRRGGVKVIGKKGEMQELGKLKKGGLKGTESSSALKL